MVDVRSRTSPEASAKTHGSVATSVTCHAVWGAERRLAACRSDRWASPAPCQGGSRCQSLSQLPIGTTTTGQLDVDLGATASNCSVTKSECWRRERQPRWID